MLIIAAISVVALLLILILAYLRVVVPTNEVHIVQSSKKTVSYGKNMDAGNTYYEWPSWVPVIGIVKSSFPLSVFDIDLSSYEAYDSGRVPFMVDVKAFFRITDSGVAAERVASFEELSGQLQSILQGAVRTILASNEIEEIMQGRGKFGELFTKEVDGQLKEWGVQTVKSIEFMDIRDAVGSEVIANIMEKKKSLIEKQSRIEVAINMKDAEVAEIDAKRQADVQRQDAEQQVGLRTAEKEQVVGIAREKSNQAVQDEAKVTAEKSMAVRQVEAVRTAEIQKEVTVVNAEAKRQVTVVEAEAQLKTTSLMSEGVRIEGQAKADADKAQLMARADGDRANLIAKADGEKAFQLAPVEAQLTVAREIGENMGYQTYLLSLEKIKAGQVVGVEQAQALKAAGIKIIVNSGDINGGVKNVMDLFTPAGGTGVGGALEALAQTDMGKNLLDKFGVTEK